VATYACFYSKQLGHQIPHQCENGIWKWRGKHLTSLKNISFIQLTKNIMDNLKNNQSNAGVIVGSLLIGAAIGGVLGILFAPDKGSNTRKKIAGKTEDFTKTVKDKFNSMVGDAKKELQEGKEKLLANSNEISHTAKL